jgi:hypothetical protein
MTASEISAAPRYPDDRPPIGAVPLPGAAEPFQRLRPTVHERPIVTPQVWDDGIGVPVDDPYVRRYWTALLGPGAIADLLRLATAAVRRRSLPRPVHLSQLARAGLVRADGAGLFVRIRIPEIPRGRYAGLAPPLRRELLDRAGAQRTTSFGASNASA